MFKTKAMILKVLIALTIWQAIGFVRVVFLKVLIKNSHKLKAKLEKALK